MSDAELIRRTLQGSQAAFGELYDRYAALIRAICRDTTGQMVTAQDLAQEVFLRAYSKLGKLKDPDRFAPWLVAMAKNVCREYRRGKFRDRHVLVGLEPVELEAIEPREDDERLDALNEAMAKLPEKERLALRVYYLQGQDVAQAMKILKVSRASLYRLLDRAKKNIEKIMDSQG